MRRRMTIVLAALLTSGAAMSGCSLGGSNERWATTQNTNVTINWDRINEAYRAASGPEDLERRVNEIYEGSEVISIAVADLDASTQEVTGFFDRNSSGAVDAGEKIFTMRRRVTGEGAAEMQTTGYGAYSAYHSPMFSIMSGMMLGSMLSNAFRPGYVPMYSASPYVTNGARLSQIRTARPFRPSVSAHTRPSGSGRSFPGRGGMPRGGARFGVRRGDRPAPVRLTA